MPTPNIHFKIVVSPNKHQKGVFRFQVGNPFSKFYSLKVTALLWSTSLSDRLSCCAQKTILSLFLHWVFPPKQHSAKQHSKVPSQRIRGFQSLPEGTDGSRFTRLCPCGSWKPQPHTRRWHQNETRFVNGSDFWSRKMWMFWHLCQVCFGMFSSVKIFSGNTPWWTQLRQLLKNLPHCFKRGCEQRQS